MTGPTGLINFFVLEASDYVEQLDSLLRDAGPAGPEAESFTRAARALRGSATMARRGGIAALAAAVERLGRALRERVLPWTPAMSAALAASIGDLRQLVRAARDYSAADEQRAQARTAELLAFAPPSMRAAAPTPIAAGSGTMFVVSGASDVAAALTAAASRPANHELHAEALRRLRGFRGVAALRDHLALAEALDVIERVARQADRQEGIPPAAATAVLAAGARQVRRLAEDIRSGRPHDRQSPEAVAFADALARHESPPVEGEVVVPVAALFFADDGPRIVRQTTAPGTTAADRFRLESAAAAEHLRRLAGEARRALQDGASRSDGDRSSSQSAATHSATIQSASLQPTAARLVELARSYGYDDLAESLDRAFANLDATDPLALSAADAVGALLVAQRRRVDDLTRRVGDLAAGRVLGSLVAVGYADPGPSRSTPVSTAAQPASEQSAGRRATPLFGVPTPLPTPMPVPEPFPQPGPPPEPAPEPEPEPTPIPTPVPVPLPAASANASVDDGSAVGGVDVPASEPAVPVGASADAATDERPTGRDLHALLATSIAGFARMQTPAADGFDGPASDDGGSSPDGAADRSHGVTDAASDPGDDEPVPVDILLYRGRSALGRALELRDEIRRNGGQPPAEQLDELFDLLDLAATA